MPWGDVENNELPMRQAALTAWRQRNKDSGEEVASMAKKWAITDVDIEFFRNSTAPSDFADKLPRTPVHTDHRNALFYDWHVEKISLEKMDQIQKEARENRLQ